MTIGLIGRKCGMTRVFTEEGVSIPVTVIEVSPNRITQIKTLDRDGYQALQVTMGTRRASRVTKPLAGHFAKAKVEPGSCLKEFRLADDADLTQYKEGQDITVEVFEAGQKIDVTGTAKGKGFAGGVKRHHFAMQDATHGNSVSHRAIGSTGQNQTPGRVFKGKKMPGQMGNVQRTTENLEVVRLDVERNLILVKGSVPGAPGGRVTIKPAMKAGGKVNAA